jgi:NAD(P)-dependent dehydrogenase (short-subunit alcohol dehydrogenase family)/phosphopantetheinyl transferase/acyl carrier protein
VEELDPAFALEADLGVDTVKQAEIIGEVRERFALPQDDAFRLADYPTITALAGWLEGALARGSAQMSGPHAEAPPAPEPAVNVRPDVPEASAPLALPLTKAALAGVDALAVLLEVIAGKTGYAVEELDPAFALEADLGVDTVKQAEIIGEVRERFALPQDDAFRLADYPTITALAGWLEGALARGSAPEVRLAREAVAAAPEAVAAAPEAAAPVTQDSSVWDGSDVSEAPPQPDPAEEARAYVRALPRVAPPPPARSALVAASALLPEAFRVRAMARMARKPTSAPGVRGLRVRVLGSGPVAEALRAHLLVLGAVDEGVPGVVIDAGLPAPALLEVAQALDATPPAEWLCLQASAPAELRAARDAGARAGFAKALGREWPGCHARVVRVDASLEPSTVAELTLRELAEMDGAMEVELSDKVRWVSMPVFTPFPPAGAPGRARPTGPVALLTGGTRGITARVAQTLADAGPCTLVLVGRTAPGPGPLDEAAVRHQARARLEAAGERVTPKRLEDLLAPLRAAEEVRRTVAALRGAGAEVEVRTCDMADPEAVRGLVREVVQRHGRLDVCVHGAGVEESRKLADKDARAFARVFEGKAVGGLALAEALPAETLFLSMGSIAGRLGNAGQVDYAAANEAMAQVCQARPRSLHVSWTAWADTGMAVRGGMEALLTHRGVELLPAQAGAALCRDLLAALEAGTLGGELLVAGGLGDFTLPPLHPLLDRLRWEGDVLVGERALSADGDPWILDHVIDGIPVLPGVIGLEWMVAVARMTAPAAGYAGVEDVRFESPVKLHGDEAVAIEIRAEPLGDGAVRATLASRRKAKTGRELHTVHFSAVVQLEGMPLLPKLRPSFLPEESIPAREIYRRFFHGPGFQVLERVEALARGGLLARARVEHATLGEGLHTAPLVLEAAFQAAGLQRLVVDDLLALPASIDAVEQVREAKDGEDLHVAVDRRETPQGPVFDIDVDGSEGRVLTVRGFRMAERGPLPPGDRFPQPPGGWAGTGTAFATEAQGALPAGDVARMSARGTAKRQADRLAGQLAARRAVAQVLGEAGFEVDREDSGAPCVPSHPELSVSLSHVEGRGVAFAVRGARAGVDMERVEPRAPGFVDTWFVPEELPLLTDDAALARAWAVKEAVLKALGTGMRGTPREVVLRAVNGGRVEVGLLGTAEARRVGLGGGDLRVRVTTLDASHVVATAILAA